MNFKKLFRRLSVLLISSAMVISVVSPTVIATRKNEQSQETNVEDGEMFVSEVSPIESIVEKIKQSPKEYAEDDKLHYVSLGASNTNGYGHHGYLDDEIYADPLAANKSQMNDYGYDKSPANAYPSLIKDALAQSTDREVELHQLAISSMRVEEVLWLLDDTYEPDEYMDWRFTGGKSWFDMAHKDGGREALRAEYRDYIANADVITVDLGWNNFGVYAFNNTMTILKEGGARYWKSPDFESVISTRNEKVYYAIRDMVLGCLMERMDLSGTVLSEDIIQKLVDVFSYAVFGACYNFDEVMEHIYELNPDAEVVVINIQNLADELIININGLELPLGDFYGEIIDFVDLYRAKKSPYAHKYSFAYAGDDGDVDTFLDEFRRWDGDVATLSQDMKDLFDMYDDNVYARSKIEYIMVGQVFGQIFAQLRNTAASYGLPAFENDDKYVYEIPEFQMYWLDGIDLATLDFNNPDTGLEEYGAAVSKHLVNLRNYTGEGKDAYNYVFDDLIKYFTGGQISSLDAAIAQRDLILGSVPAEQQSGYADLIQSVTILQEARAQFNNAFFALHSVYVNTLNYAYDTLGTIIQYTLQFNAFYITSDSMSNHNSKTEELLGYVVNTFTNNTMLKFYEELDKVGLNNSGVVAPEITVDKELFSDLFIQAVCALEVRYDFGNSFFAHPSVRGNQQIKDAVMDALTNGSHADDFAHKKATQYADFQKEVLKLLCKKVQATIKEYVMRLGCEVNEKINAYVQELLDSLYEQAYARLEESEVVDNILSAADTIGAMIDFVKNRGVTY